MFPTTRHICWVCQSSSSTPDSLGLLPVGAKEGEKWGTSGGRRRVWCGVCACVSVCVYSIFWYPPELQNWHKRWKIGIAFSPLSDIFHLLDYFPFLSLSVYVCVCLSFIVNTVLGKQNIQYILNWSYTIEHVFVFTIVRNKSNLNEFRRMCSISSFQPNAALKSFLPE